MRSRSTSNRLNDLEAAVPAFESVGRIAREGSASRRELVKLIQLVPGRQSCIDFAEVHIGKRHLVNLKLSSTVGETVAGKFPSESLFEIGIMPKLLGTSHTAGGAKDGYKLLLKQNSPVFRNSRGHTHAANEDRD
jgi:hypothetical protein